MPVFGEPKIFKTYTTLILLLSWGFLAERGKTYGSAMKSVVLR